MSFNPKDIQEYHKKRRYQVNKSLGILEEREGKKSNLFKKDSVVIRNGKIHKQGTWVKTPKEESEDLHVNENIFKAQINQELEVRRATGEVIDLEKGFGSDLQKRFPNGRWVTASGSRVFINGGKIIVGLDGFNGTIDEAFKKDKEESGKNGDVTKEERDLAEKFMKEGKASFSGMKRPKDLKEAVSWARQTIESKKRQESREDDIKKKLSSESKSIRSKIDKFFNEIGKVEISRGSQKQISWAEKIRGKVISEMKQSLKSKLKAAEKSINPEQMVNSQLKSFFNINVESDPSHASYWIDRR